MKDKDSIILTKRKRKLAKRLERKQWSDQRQPMLAARNIIHEMAERSRAISCGDDPIPEPTPIGDGRFFLTGSYGGCSTPQNHLTSLTATTYGDFSAIHVATTIF